jgi:hypothetical protein
VPWFGRRPFRRGSPVATADELLTALTREASQPHPDLAGVHAILDALVALDAPGLEALLEALQGDQPMLRSIAAEQLRTLKDPRTVGTLIVALRHKDDGVRLAAATALTHMGDTRAAEALARAIDDPSPEVRRRAAIALGERADARAVPELVRMARTDPPTLAWEMVRWLAQAQNPLPGVPPRLDRPPSSDAVAEVLRPVLAEVPDLAEPVRSAADRSVFDLDGATALATIRGPGPDGNGPGLRSAGA